ncbi:morphogenetic protein [Enterobacter kobei]|uniref:morphogenetic protein n=1 Tax=Enterobacter kobei TaxID=208224 RepID=UPI003D6E3223
MKERGMIFNSEMVRAILDGRKLQTRRIMKNQPAGDYPDTTALIRSLGNGFQWYGHYGKSSIFNCPFGAVGDRIWVRETFCAVPDHEEPAGCSALLYAADGNGPYGKWTPSIHMPRWASRLTLEIAGVRVERLNSISQEDAQAEGMELTGWRPTYSDPDSGGEVWTPYDNFAQLWESIYGEESWKANPWVWVIEFKRLEV